MKKNKITFDQVLEDDLSNPFWQSLTSNPQYHSYADKISSILARGQKDNGDIGEVIEDSTKWERK